MFNSYFDITKGYMEGDLNLMIILMFRCKAKPMTNARSLTLFDRHLGLISLLVQGCPTWRIIALSK